MTRTFPQPAWTEKSTEPIETSLNAGGIEIRISDNGPGIPEDIQQRVFDPFFTTKEVGKGTGQGLAIARSVVVDQHGGELSVDSRPGEGATFVILLPLEEGRQDTAAVA